METLVKIGLTRYIVHAKRAVDIGQGYGPFVVRATSRRAAIAYVRRTWNPTCIGFEVRPIRRDMI